MQCILLSSVFWWMKQCLAMLPTLASKSWLEQSYCICFLTSWLQVYIMEPTLHLISIICTKTYHSSDPEKCKIYFVSVHYSSLWHVCPCLGASWSCLLIAVSHLWVLIWSNEWALPPLWDCFIGYQVHELFLIFLTLDISTKNLKHQILHTPDYYLTFYKSKVY